MLRYIYGNDLTNYPVLQDSMHRDRAAQFADRLKWAVHVDENGWERDEYDALNPLYVIWENPDGTHGGSMRFLPTTEQTMVNDHFSALLNGVDICSPFIWECTRFVLGQGANSRVAAAMMLAGGELMRAFSLTHLLGVFDPRMVRIYSMIGASPEVLGSSGEGRDKISVGLWPYRPEDRIRVLKRAGLSSEISEHWFSRSFGHPIRDMQKVA
ncbi:acyl-homoserine-lactone synthase [Cognatiyoonia sp. IB215446]|uniref:acyl-homoserine-lactone synthase n=1 Tax=Cognatiyoonia sp. IB215446 TaxID=3097355 RepID=UPI002A12B0C6|nr:acyl-homoserine-lactone synthase [Cognatiyoonia sp. IB215446]MDX8347025.1 acyl-homoserine-lactone synthase [Cognatiyoonia sp. IB215446]